MDQQNKLFVGNLDFSVTSDELREFFSQFGTVTDATVVVDKFSGRSRGFGFVTFDSREALDEAKKANEQEFKNRKLIVSDARPRQENGNRPRGGGGDRGGFRRDLRQ